jgi:hypothetical protein
VLGASFGGSAGLAAGRVGVRADQGGLPGGGEVAGGGPGGGDQAGDDAQVGEVLGGGGPLAAAGGDRGAVRVEQPQQVLLGSECLDECVGRLRRGSGLGAAEEVAAGAQPVAAGGAAGWVRVPAGGGVDRGMGGQRDEGRQPAAVGGPQVGWLPAGRAGVLQQPLAARAGEHDREPPEPVPGSAELLLDGAVRVAGQALRAVAGGPGQDPGLLDEDPARLALAAQVAQAGRRVAAGQAGQGQRGDLARVKPGRLRERPGGRLAQGEHPAGGDRPGARDQAGESGELAGRNARRSR